MTRNSKNQNIYNEERTRLLTNQVDAEIGQAGSTPNANSFSTKIHVEYVEPETPDQTEKPLRTFYEAFFVVMPLFCGYASLFALQREVKKVYGIGDDNSSSSHVFGLAASLVYIGNFVFRLGHNFLFAYFYPRTRVVISMCSMALSMATISLIFFVLGRDGHHPSLAWVFIAYAFGGIGIGTFESNLLSTITPLGKKTKLWAIVAIPVGVNTITVFGFILLDLGLPAGYIYLAVFLFILVGLAVFMLGVAPAAGTGNAITLGEFLHQLTLWREWLPQIKWHCLALMVDMFCVSMLSPGVILYIYDENRVKLHWFHTTIKSDWLFAIYDACFFVGDTISRKIWYPRKIVFPFFFLIFALVGAVAGFSYIPEIAPICGFMVAFCNGSIYAQANRQIDSTIDKKFNLIAFSFWLFIGDIGSVIGSNSISYISVLVKNIYH